MIRAIPIRATRLPWSRWRPFPNPRRPEPGTHGLLHAPFGPGVYQLRNRRTRELVLFGIGKNCAARMTSLLPALHGGMGTRNNAAKRAYVARHVKNIEYRTLPTRTREEAAAVELTLKAVPHRFAT